MMIECLHEPSIHLKITNAEMVRVQRAHATILTHTIEMNAHTEKKTEAKKKTKNKRKITEQKSERRMCKATSTNTKQRAKKKLHHRKTGWHYVFVYHLL